MDLVDIWKDIVKNASQAKFVSQQEAVFNQKFKVMLSEVQIYNVYGYTFNMLSPDDIFNTQE